MVFNKSPKTHDIKRLRRILLLFFVTGAILCMVVIVLFQLIGKDIPANPTTEKISLEIKSQRPPVSQKLTAFVMGNPSHKIDYWKFQALYKQAQKGRRWYIDLSAAKAQLQQLTPGLTAFEQAIAGKGCLPSPSHRRPKNSNNRIQYLAYLRGMKLMGLQAIYDTQTGHPEQAAARLLRGAAHIDMQMRHCAHPLLPTLIAIAAQKIVAQFIAFPILHKKLTPTSRRQLFQVLSKQASASPNPMPDTFRAELAFMIRAMQESHKEDSIREEFSHYGLPFPIWPWWDTRKSEIWLMRQSKVWVYMAMQPFGPTLWKRHPEDRFGKEIRRMPKWKTLFQYNYFGFKETYTSSFRMRSILLRWHQARCISAAWRALLHKALAQRRSALPGLPVQPNEHNPLTGKAFSFLKKGMRGQFKVCGIDKPEIRRIVWFGDLKTTINTELKFGVNIALPP